MELSADLEAGFGNLVNLANRALPENAAFTETTGTLRHFTLRLEVPANVETFSTIFHITSPDGGTYHRIWPASVVAAGFPSRPNNSIAARELWREGGGGFVNFPAKAAEHDSYGIAVDSGAPITVIQGFLAGASGPLALRIYFVVPVVNSVAILSSRVTGQTLELARTTNLDANPRNALFTMPD